MSNYASIGTSGPLLYLDASGATSEIRLTDLGDPAKLGSTWTIPGDDNKRLAIYAQDRWTATNKVISRPACATTGRLPTTPKERILF